MRLDLAPPHPFPFSPQLLPLGSSEVVAVLARLLIPLRLLAVAALVALTSFAVVVAPAHASLVPAPESGRLFTSGAGGAAARGGTKVAAARVAVCRAGLWGMAACGAVAAGTLYLSTDHGQQFTDDLMAEIFGETRGNAPSANRTCRSTVAPVAWGQHSFGAELTLEGERRISTLPMPGGTWESCLDWLGTDYPLVSFDAYCMSGTTGDIYVESNQFLSFDFPSATQCTWSSQDWLAGVMFRNPASGAVNTISGLGYISNPLWPGSLETVLDQQDANPQTKVTLKCRNSATGAVATRTITVNGILDPGAECAAGENPIDRMVQLVRFGGALLQDVYGIGLTADGMADYPECTTAGACDMVVVVDGVACSSARSNCVSWWDIAQVDPSRVQCKWGPYSLPYGECSAFRDSYVSPDGSWVPVDAPSGSMPIPYYPTDPGWRPAPPVGNGGDPSWVDPALCPPAPASFFAYGTSEYGLQPIAVQAMRCFAMDHGDFRLTSGWRSVDHSASYSDHPHGLALDLAPPDWSSPAGNQRGWDAVAYWLWNSPALGVRYVIFDGAIWWPETGWHVYTGPSPHRDHVHVSLDPYAPPSTSAPSPSPTVPYPVPTPSPEPAPPTNPAPPTAPPGTDPPGGGGGLPPADGPNCDGSDVTWNPVSWVLVPLRCAFVPSTDVSQLLADKAGALTDTSVGAWLAAPIEVGNAVSAAGGAGPVVALGRSETFSTLSDGEASSSSGGPLFPRLRSGLDGAGSGSGELAALSVDGLAAGESFGTQSFSTLATCQGPAMTVDLGFVGAGSTTIHPIAACDGPMAAISTIVRVGLAVLINATVLIAIPEMLLSVMGFKRTVTSASIAAGWKEDTV